MGTGGVMWRHSKTPTDATHSHLREVPAMHVHPPLSAVHPTVRHLLRILWNIATLSESARRYPDVAFRRIWEQIPETMSSTRPVRAYGTFLHHRACAIQRRRPLDTVFHTFFLRNAPHFAVLRRLMLARPLGTAIRIAAIGCSSGAELYTAVWVVSCARPDLRITATGVDIDAAALEKARAGVYARHEHELTRLPDESVDHLSAPSPNALFARTGDILTVAPGLATTTSWVLGDARDSGLAKAIGSYDVVLANNILCHMYDPEAEGCLRNVASLVTPGGHLFTYGVDLDVKSRVVQSLGLVPVRDRVEEIYLADWNALAHWPFTYWGQEPLDKHRRDWEARYAAVYQRPA